MYKERNPRYNKECIKIIEKTDRTIYKLYREGHLIYIGVKEHDEVGTKGNDGRFHDERSGEASSS